MMATNVSRVSAAFLVAGALAMGCSHAWDVLEPLPGSTGTGGGASGSGSGGAGGTSTTSSAGGAGGAATSSAQGPASSSAQGSGGDVSSSTAEASSSDASSSASTGGGGATAYYGAVLAACNSDVNLDINACEALFGPGSMDVDGMTDAGTVTIGFVRFDLDSTIAGKTVDGVTLRLTTLKGDNADSDHSGEIYAVDSFDSSTLAMGQPMPLGAGPIAGDLGPVALGQDYYWGLPKDLVVSDGHVFLAVYSASDDGAHYWNDHGTVPPLLIVDYH
jgi:hypothetical protein